MRVIDEMNQPKQWFSLGGSWNCLERSRRLIQIDIRIVLRWEVVGFRSRVSFPFDFMPFNDTICMNCAHFLLVKSIIHLHLVTTSIREANELLHRLSSEHLPDLRLKSNLLFSKKTLTRQVSHLLPELCCRGGFQRKPE